MADTSFLISVTGFADYGNVEHKLLKEKPVGYVYFLSICFFIMTVFFVYVIYVLKISHQCFCFSKETIRILEGRILYDSSFTKNGNHLVTVFVKNVGTCFEQRGSACGIVRVLSEEKVIISSGIRVRLSGSFSDGSLFICNDFQILDRSVLNDLREFFIRKLEGRIMSDKQTDADLLSMMLLLGRAENYSTRLKDLASACGCLHVLALSGMHLHAVTFIVKPVKNKVLKYALSVLLVLSFLFVAGPRPSLVRASIMVCLCFLPSNIRFFAAAMLHLVVFPLSFINIGSVYGYLSVFALIYLSKYMQGLRFVVSSLSVLLLNAPLQLILSGTWYPAAVIAGPVASVLACASMLMGFLICCFGHLSYLVRMNGFICNLMVKTFETASAFPSASVFGYLILCAVCLFLFLLSPVRRAANRISAQKHFAVIEKFQFDEYNKNA